MYILAALVLLSAISYTEAAQDPLDYAKFLTDNKASAIVADDLNSRFNPQGWALSSYAAINDAVPVPVFVACHSGPQPYPGPSSASNSTSAREYVNDIAYIVGDGYRPATHIEPKQDYNQSWSLGLIWGGQ